jgi:CubicO group peptidase (beta-lactamase class C family)
MLELSQARLHLQKGVQENFWPGFSLAVFSHEKFAAYSGGNVPTPATSVSWYSAGKPVTSLGVLHLTEQKPDLWPLPMEKTFPELLGTYLGNLTLLDILTHRTGLRLSTLDVLAPEQEILHILARAQPADFSLQPRQAAYDPRGGWWLLGRWIERHTGHTWSDYLHRHVLSPCGAGDMFFTTDTTKADVPMLEKKGSTWIPTPLGHGPGGGFCGTAISLARFYRTLLSQGTNPETGTTVFSPNFIKNFSHRWREGEKDMTFGQITDFGLGVMLDSHGYGTAKPPYGFGTTSSRNTFGHGGACSSIAFADPAKDLAVALCLTGQVPENKHQPRMLALLDLLRSDLA